MRTSLLFHYTTMSQTESSILPFLLRKAGFKSIEEAWVKKAEADEDERKYTEALSRHNEENHIQVGHLKLHYEVESVVETLPPIYRFEITTPHVLNHLFDVTKPEEPVVFTRLKKNKPFKTWNITLTMLRSGGKRGDLEFEQDSGGMFKLCAFEASRCLY
jgi:hypothetical protein